LPFIFGNRGSISFISFEPISSGVAENVRSAKSLRLDDAEDVPVLSDNPPARELNDTVARLGL
jgi:hypothetical protein